MNSKNRRFEAGGNPAQGPHPDVANPTPGSAVGENFPDQPDEHPAERPQDQPDLDAFAARMGTDRIDDQPSADESESPSADESESDAAEDDAATSDWRGSVSTALSGLGSGARSVGERVKGVSEKLVAGDEHGELDLAEVRRRVAKVRTVMLTSMDGRGTLSSRPLVVQDLSEAGDIQFVVAHDADWVSPDMGAVNVAFVDGSSTWISIAGRAVLDDDRQLLDALWSPSLDTYFPEGRSGAVVVRVESDRWEYWTSPNRLGRLVESARARISDDRPKPGESGTIET